MDEMLEETMEGMDDEEELESEANEEVEKILFEITDGKLGVQNSKVGALPVGRVLLLSVYVIDRVVPSTTGCGGTDGGRFAEGRRDGESYCWITQFVIPLSLERLGSRDEEMLNDV